MNLKKIGKRLLYLIGGLVLFFVTLVLLIADLEEGGQWITQYRVYLALGVIFGLALVITSFQKNMGSNKDTQNLTNQKPTEPPAS